MKKITRVIGFLLLTALMLQAQGPMASHAPVVPPTKASTPSPVNPTKPVVRVNGVTIVEGDVEDQMQRLFPYYSMHGGKVPDQYKPEIRQKAIDQLVIEELVFQQAKRRNFQVPATMTKDVLRQARGRFGSDAEYTKFAVKTYGSVAEFERRIRRAVVIAQYVNVQIRVKSTVTEAQLRDIYNKNKKRFRRPESISFQTISVNIPEKPSAAQQTLARKRIEELLVAAKATRNYEEFGSLAEKSSEDDYRVMMGDHKWQHRVALEPALDQAIAALQPGQISGIISIPSQLTIVRLNDRRPEKQMEFSEIKADLRKDIEASTEKSRSEALKAQLRKGAKIEML